MRVYLDVCCLNRPFDDQTINRIRFETEAIYIIFEKFGETHFQWIISDIVDEEIDRTPDEVRREKLFRLIQYATESIQIEVDDLSRVKTLIGWGFKLYDAMHVTCAEKGKVSVLLTTDDQFLRLAKRMQEKLDVAVENPLLWVQGELLE